MRHRNLALTALIVLAGAFACDGDADRDGDTDTDGDADGDADADVDADGEADEHADGEVDGDGDAAWDPRFDAFVQALLDDLDASDAYGVSAAVMESGVVTFAQAFGSRGPDPADPLTPSALMQIGSTTKHMTAVALLRLVAAGRLSLDDTLESLLPELDFRLDPGWDDGVTLHLMLSHQGGFFDTVPWDGAADDDLLASWTYGTFDEQFFLMSPPGAFWNYSNPNFALAGLVTQALDDRAWPDIVREDLFVPLGMDRTFARKAEVEADGDYALSYGLGVDDLTTGRLGPVAMEDVPDPAWARPAGLVWTTPTQMMTWARFIMHGDASVLSDELRGLVTEGQVDTLYLMGTMLYGYGMFVESGYLTADGTWYAMPVWEHGGNTISFSNVLYILPEQDFALAICSSGLGTDFRHSTDVAVTTLVDLPEPSAAPAYVVDPTQFDRHVGTYNDPWNVGDMIISREGDTLEIDMPQLDRLGYDVSPELTPVSTATFYVYMDGTPLDLTFIPVEDGGPSVYVRNRSFVTVRVPEGSTPRPMRRAPTREDVARMLVRARLEASPLDRVLRSSRTR